MKQNENPNFLLELEQAIIARYGKETVINPQSKWNNEKEQEYLQQIKELYKKETSNTEEPNSISINGVLLDRKLFTEENNKVCIICKKYSLKKTDDLYLNKYKCCFNCWEAKVQGKEVEWEKNL